MKAKPNHLVIYLSGLCNLACGYCYARFGGPAIKKAALLRGVRAFLAAGAPDAKLTFLGGEPALHPGLLRAAVALARRLGGPALPVKVFTNGTLLTPALLDFLEGAGVELVLSLDGPRAVNDARRRFRAGRGSAYRAALAAFRGRELPAASLVVGPGSAPGLARNLEALRRAGFGKLAWAPDISALWDAAARRALRRGMLEAKADYFRALRAGAAPYAVANIYEVLEQARRGAARLPGCSNVTLAPDGFFYPCDKMFAGGTGAAAPFRVGPDGAGREKFFRLAARRAGRPSQVLCPVSSWAPGYFAGADGAPGRREFLEGQAQVRAEVAAWLAGLAREGLKYPAFRRVHGLPPGGAA